MDNLLKGLTAPFLFVGIGNIMKGDDAAGPLVADRLRHRRPDIAVINCGDIPENYLRQLTAHRSGTIVFIDAADMREQPGTVRLFKSEKIAVSGFMTHGMPLNMLAEYIAAAAGCPVYLLGIQPKRMRLGDSFSPEVAKSIDTLVQQLAATL